MSLRSKLDRLKGFPTGKPAAPFAPDPTPAAPEPGPAPALRSTLDELRARMQVVLSRSVEKRAPRPVDDSVELPFVAEETEHGVRHRRVLHFGGSARVGRAPVSTARHADARLLSLLALDPALATLSPERALYIDTETTGLSGGAGTVAFLVGIARFGGPLEGLVVEQLLVRQLGEEAPMLALLRQRIEEADFLVSFNGKAFDLPLLRTRFVLARIPPPTAKPHLDLLHVARRLHKPRGIDCRLVSLEERILGFVRHDDCPSGEVSGRYLHFLRTGDARALLGVVEHNAWDVVTMAALLGLYGEPLAGSQLHAGDLVGVARTLKRARAHDEALAAADLAAAGGAGPESLRARAEVHKARGDRARALADLEVLLAEAPSPGVRLELAKLYEHHVKDAPGLARALELVDEGVAEPEEAQARRRTRLEAKREARRQRELFPQPRKRVKSQ
jgi:uncharacterized protein YprB with RNaseH-like and TPR domain